MVAPKGVGIVMVPPATRSLAEGEGAVKGRGKHYERGCQGLQTRCGRPRRVRRTDDIATTVGIRDAFKSSVVVGVVGGRRYDPCG